MIRQLQLIVPEVILYGSTLVFRALNRLRVPPPPTFRFDVTIIQPPRDRSVHIYPCNPKMATNSTYLYRERNSADHIMSR